MDVGATGRRSVHLLFHEGPTMIRHALRHVLPGIGVILVLAVGVASMAAGTATAAIKSTIKQMFVILNDEELKTPGRAEERRQQLEKVIGNRIAYDEMAKRSLGPQWSQLNDEERQEFVRLYAQLLRDTYSSRFDRYTDEKVEFLQETLQGDYAEVRTRLTSSKFSLDVDYRMLQRAGDWRVYDIVVDGISLVHSYREQFTKIIRTYSYEELLAKLRQKTGEIKPFAEASNP
jgi:phospholipid transport system substrate-binding protein